MKVKNYQNLKFRVKCYKLEVKYQNFMMQIALDL
jgi:hypothetical protein